MTCKNCKTDFNGNFCPECGQKKSTKRLSILAVFNDFVFAITDTERGFLKTVIDLSQRPGPMVQNYIEGKRARYISAGKYTFFLVVLFTINISLLENHFGFFRSMTEKVNSLQVNDKGLNLKGEGRKNKESSSSSSQSELTKTPEDTKKVNIDLLGIKKELTGEEALQFIKTLMPLVHSKLFDYSKYLAISWIPLFSILSLLFFFRSPHNFAEHFTFNAFVFSHMLFIFIIISPLFWFAPTLSSTTFTAITVVTTFYLIFSYMQFFSEQRMKLVKTAIVLSVGLFSYFVLIASLTAALLIYLVYENQHLLG